MTDYPLDPAILERVQKLIASVLRIPVAKIGVTTALIAELGAESIDLLELRFMLEKEFEVKIADRELQESAKKFTQDDIANKFCAGIITWDMQERLKHREAL